MKIHLYLVICSILTLPICSGAATIKLSCWEYDRGNTRVVEHSGLYGDYRDKHPALMLDAGDTLPYFVEYDLDFPATGEYTLRVRYASAGKWPMDVLLDNKKVGTCCAKKTNNSPPYMDRHPNVWKGLPERTWDKHGAEWEESLKMTVAAGKHTLKFTRNGPPPNLLAIELKTEEPAPKDWKSAKREVDLGRIPPPYRRAFTPADSVNIETLRSAIEDNIRTFGPEYAGGEKYLKQLAELEKKEDSKDALRSLRSKAMLANPVLRFDKLLFATQKHRGSSTYTGHMNHGKPGGNLCVLSPVSQDGKVVQLVPELTNGIYGRFTLSFDATKIVFCYTEDGGRFRIYEIDIDPATGQRVPGKKLRQLTFDGETEANTIKEFEGVFCGKGFDDIDPCYLPNGKIMFASTRSQRSVLCFPATVTTLYVMDADGRNMHCISKGQVNEINPIVLDDGRVAYMRWEYIDKGFGNVQSLWAIRPDGSGSDHIFKNTVIRPGAMLNARSIPGSRKLIAIGAGHHGGLYGPVVLLDTRRHRRTADAMKNLTPEISYPGMGAMPGNGGVFKEPYPFSERFFLVSHRPGVVKDEKDVKAKKAKPNESFGIYVLDAWGNRTALYRDPELSCCHPIPLRPQPVPTDIAPVATTDAAKKQKLATMFLLDVYEGLEGIERGRVKYIRVMDALNLSWYDTYRAGKQGDSAGMQASAVSLGGDVAIKKVHGIAKVHEDGSACFTVPAEENIFFQALDENYMELHRMRTFLNLMPGEQRACVGCHEVRRKAPRLKRAFPEAMAHPVQALMPQPGDTGPRMVHYTLDVQPILNKHCLRCHSGESPKGDLVLTGEPTKLWNRSYENLTKKELVSYLHTCGFGSSHVPLEPPLTFGSHRSKMVERIRKAPCKSGITREDFVKIVTWIDANAPFYGTHEGKKNLKWKDDPDFRPLPTLVKK
ncbi:MAG: hypothetical protein QGH15_00085 [Kiritimatiellia bacterium]|jgi:hypothetical protein|nr:hypothetical protein [Kiritimatiellia bacterium]